MKRSLMLVLFSTAFIIACGANKSVIKNNVSGGDAEAKFISEECCVKSEEVYKNFAEAAKWYRKVAEQGDANAQRNLGMYYIQEKRDNVRGICVDFAERQKRIGRFNFQTCRAGKTDGQGGNRARKEARRGIFQG